MALPNEGPLSFSMIASELGIGTPFSLNGMSNQAGFSTPSSVGIFYGYSAGGGGGGLTLFFRNNETGDPVTVCKINEPCCNPVWHNGQSALPEIGEMVFEDPDGQTVLPNNEGGWYGMSDQECGDPLNSFYIDPKGTVQKTDVCFFKK